MVNLQTSVPALPEELRKLFWDHDFDRLNWDSDHDLITHRILASGPWEAVRWLRRELGDARLRSWILNRQGRGLSPQQLRFWQLILGLPAAQVDGWLAAAATDPWHRRQAS